FVTCSSAANPIVYIMCCRHFHQRFVSMVTRTIHCCARSPEKYQTVIADADKYSLSHSSLKDSATLSPLQYARMSVVTHSSISRRHRKVKQRERAADVSLSVRLLPQVDQRGSDTRRAARMRMRCGRGAYAAGAVAAATAAAAGGAASTDSPPLLLPPSPTTLRHPRASTTSATSFHWAVSASPSSTNKYRHFRCTNPQKVSTASITVD
ncbi:hypothetical protein PMAYCL1PPCAC_00580, partial [Pristionchus mayeri]